MNGRPRVVGRPPYGDAEEGVRGTCSNVSLRATGADHSPAGSLQREVEEARLVGIVDDQRVPNHLLDFFSGEIIRR